MRFKFNNTTKQLVGVCIYLLEVCKSSKKGYQFHMSLNESTLIESP